MKLHIFLIFLLTVLLSAEGIEFSGSSSFFGQICSEEKEWSEIPSEYWRWRLNPLLRIQGIPIAADLFLSSEESAQRQNLNRVYISSAPSSGSGDNSILSWISSIGLGTTTQYFTPFTLNGATISGFNIELEPGAFYLTAAVGRANRAIEPQDDDPGTYKRDIYAIMTGVGSPSDSHMHLCFLRGLDKDGSISEDSTFRITPAENWVGSLDFGSVLLNGKFRLEGEVAGSMFTRDVRSPGIESNMIPNWLLEYSGANISSAFGWALDLASSFQFSDNIIRVSFRRIDPGFQSMGAPFLRNDEIVFEARADRYFMNRQLFTGLWYRRNNDNLLSTKSFTNTGNAIGIRSGCAFRGYPRVTISYAPSSRVMEDSASSWTETSLLSVSASYTRGISGIDFTSMLSVALHDNSAGSGSGNYSSTNIVLRETVSLPSPVTFSGCFSCRRTRSGAETTWKYLTDLRGTWYPSYNLSVTIGGNYATGAGERKIGLIIGGGVPISDELVANLRGEYTMFSSTIEKDYNNMTAGAGITYIW